MKIKKYGNLKESPSHFPWRHGGEYGRLRHWICVYMSVGPKRIPLVFRIVDRFHTFAIHLKSLFYFNYSCQCNMSVSEKNTEYIVKVQKFSLQTILPATVECKSLMSICRNYIYPSKENCSFSNNFTISAPLLSSHLFSVCGRPPNDEVSAH